MAVTLNASTTTGLVQSADTSGTIELQNNGTTRLTVNSSGATIPTATVTTLNTPTGVLATQNGMTGIAKAWVFFNGTGTVAINGSFNVSSITDNGTGDYTVNFTTAMPNANYSVSGVASDNNSSYSGTSLFSTTLGTRTFSTSSVRVLSVYTFPPSAKDADVVCVAIFSS
jgi:hypothetical protein